MAMGSKHEAGFEIRDRMNLMYRKSEDSEEYV
jgi:hypothetical protein